MLNRVLITGGAGYVGSVLAEHLLDRGYAVTVVDNLMYRQSSMFHLCANPKFEFVFGDVRDENLIKGLVAKADVIVPLAAIVGAPACSRDPWLAQAVNFDAVKLINSLRSPSQLVVYPNTNSGYGTKSSDVHCTEDSPLEPISLYGVTKVRAEQMLLDFPNTITLRLATVFGASPRMRLDLLVNDFVYTALTQKTLVIFEKDFKRNFIHIRDVADCFIHSIEHSDRMTGRPYNAGLDAANISKGQLAYKIKDHIPDLYIHFSEVGSDPDKRNYIVSNERLRKAGFTAQRSLDEGITELIKGYRMMVHAPYRNI